MHGRRRAPTSTTTAACASCRRPPADSSPHRSTCPSTGCRPVPAVTTHGSVPGISRIRGREAVGRCAISCPTRQPARMRCSSTRRATGTAGSRVSSRSKPARCVVGGSGRTPTSSRRIRTRSPSPRCSEFWSGVRWRSAPPSRASRCKDSVMPPGRTSSSCVSPTRRSRRRCSSRSATPTGDCIPMVRPNGPMTSRRIRCPS